MTNTANWIKLADLPFDRYRNCARSPVLINNDIILSPNNDNNLYKFNTKSEEWSEHYFGDYSLNYHAQCLSNDGKQLYLFDGYYERVLLIINVAETLNYNEIIETRRNIIVYGYTQSIDKSLFIPKDIKLLILSYFGEYYQQKILKHIKHSLHTGMYPVILPDPKNNELIHIIGGQWNKDHYVLNIDNGEINTLHTFQLDGYSGLRGPGIISISHEEQRWYLMHGKIPIHIFDFKKRIWNSTNIKMPEKHEVSSFGYVISPNYKYILLFGGDHVNALGASAAMLIFDIELMKYSISNIKTPKNWMNAAMTKSDDIHLFVKGEHYKMNINKVNLIRNDKIEEMRIWLKDIISFSDEYSLKYCHLLINNGWNLQKMIHIKQDHLIQIGIVKTDDMQKIYQYSKKIKRKQSK